MSKGLEEILNPYQAIIELDNEKKRYYYHEEQVNTIEKELKALEIIKVILTDFIEFNVIELPHINKFHYEIKIFNEAIYVSKEKYDLLKEVLKND